MLTSLLAYLIEALFFTDVWVIVYMALLDYLNFALFPLPVETLGNPLAHPEPFEISLYLVLLILFAGIIWLYHLFFTRFLLKIRGVPIAAQLLILLSLMLFFINRLGSYPLAGDFYPYPPRSDKLIYIGIFFFYCLTIMLITVELKILEKVLKKKIFSLILAIFLVIIIGLLTFDPQFNIAPLDAAFFYGPVWEITHGKLIFTDIPSLYGFLSLFLFSFINSIFHMNFIYLPIFLWILYIFEYLISFYLIWKVSKSLPFAILGMFSIITVNYYSLTHTPQTGPMRWAPIFLLLFLFYRVKKIESIRLIASLPVLVFWNIDSGMALLMGYLVTIGMFFLAKILSFKRLLLSGISLIGSIIFFFGLVETVHFIFTQKLIDFLGMFETLKRNAVAGALMWPLEFSTYFWLFILLYLSCVIYFFSKTSSKLAFLNKEKNITEPSLILLSANLSLFGAIYFVGRSVPHNLFNISPFVLLTFFLLFGSALQNISSLKIKLIVLACIFLFFIVFPGYHRKEFLAGKLIDKYDRLLNGRIFTSEIDTLAQQKYSQEVELIKNQMKEPEITIISTDDTYLFFLTEKRNLLNTNPIIEINMQYEIDQALKKASKVCPQKIAADCQIYKKCTPYKTLTKGWPDILPIVLTQLEKKCEVSYEPTICTKQLCIAVANKK
ncbi:hypothetical protein HY357_03645 [Candidatus Roizmanbacteria bacterium]|nr:hypothetical protein [Candidatus Roizmanbacteria bacterium]